MSGFAQDAPAPLLAGLLLAPDAPAGVSRDAPAVMMGDEQWSWDDVRGRARAVAQGLTDAGVQPGQVVGVQLTDGVALIATLFGVWQAGAVYLPLNPRLPVPERDWIVDAAAPAVLVTAEGTEGLAGRTARHEPDIALVQMTSGTTGAPKAVLLRHSGVLTLLDAVVAKLRGGSSASPAKPAMPNLIPVSLSLWAGIYNVLFAFRVGAPAVLLGRFEPEAFVAAVRRHEIRSTVLPPAALAMLCDDESIDSLEPLRYVRSITAPLSVLGARRFRERFGIAVLNSYGQTEIGGEIVGWTAADSREHGETKLGSVGRPHAGVEVRVVGDDGRTLTDPAVAGELWVRTPALSAGYADGSDLSDRLSRDGWFRTGDIGRVDVDGFVWVEGRVSDMINRGGLKVTPGEVEEVLRLAPAVGDVAVVGVADERLGEVPVAFVVPAAGAAAVDAREMEALCRRHLAPYKVPVRFETIDSLPRNEVGKVLRARLAAL